MTTDPCDVTHDEKQRMIADAAYFRAARRGFADSNPLEDWLAAEAEIEAALQAGCRRRPAGVKPADHRQAGLLGAVTDWWQRWKPHTPEDRPQRRT